MVAAHRINRGLLERPVAFEVTTRALERLAIERDAQTVLLGDSQVTLGWRKRSAGYDIRLIPPQQRLARRVQGSLRGCDLEVGRDADAGFSAIEAEIDPQRVTCRDEPQRPFDPPERS